MDPAGIAQRFERLPSATVFDVLDRHGLGDSTCLSHQIRPLSPGTRLAGPAYTIRWTVDPRRVEDWRPANLKRIGDYFAPISSGAVVVVDGGADEACGHWGEMLSMMAVRSGARGVVVDGGTRDSEGIKRIDGWLAFARYTSPIESIGRCRIHDVEVPLLLEGALGARVPVSPGDWVFADDDAVLVVPQAHVEAILTESEELEELEEKARVDLLAGVDFEEVFRRYGRA